MKQYFSKMDERIEKLVHDAVQQGNESRQQLNELLQVFKNIPQIGGEIRAIVQPQQQDAQAVRAEKLQRLTLALRKSNKIRDFKDSSEADIKTWLKKFDFEIVALKRMVGIVDDLTDAEYIPLCRDKIEYTVIKRLEAIFEQSNPVLAWDTITKADLHRVLIAEFRPKDTDISQVLAQFGPNRFRKASNMTVSDFYYRWVEQLPDIMKPNTEAERTNYVDLMNRSLFYFCLDDHYIQEQICNMKEANPKLKTFLDEAIAAEAKRKSFKDIGASSSSLDNSSGIPMILE